ncbi:MAG: ATP-binding protein [Labedaea sp.]
MDTSGDRDDGRHFALDFPGHRSLPLLRTWIRSMAPNLTPDELVDAELVGTELATNALEHANGPRCVRVSYHAERQVLRIEVDDASPDLPPTPGTSRLGRHRGRGLNMIAAMAQWGVHRRQDSKTLWAEIPTGQSDPEHAVEARRDQPA